MIEATHGVGIEAGISAVWDYVRHIGRWAELMPGFRACDLIDEDHSRWTLKVGVGGLLRTVLVMVDVESWDGPERVDFRYRLENDPVSGTGTYRAVAIAPECTEIVLQVTVASEGSMARMWEAMGRPLLPRFVRSFAEQLKVGIEDAAADRVPAPEPALPPCTKGNV